MAVTDYLRRQCLALSPEDRADLAGMLLQSLEGRQVNCDEVLTGIADTIRDVYGVDIRERSRREPLPDLRIIALCLARQVAPLSQSQVARWLGIKPCTANYYEAKMRAALSSPWINPRLVSEYKHIANDYNEKTQWQEKS